MIGFVDLLVIPGLGSMILLILRALKKTTELNLRNTNERKD
jgi:hypothetical protein